MPEYPPFKQKAQTLRVLLEGNITKPQYQRGYGKWADGRPKTYCNIYATKMGELSGYDMSAFYKNHDKKNAYNSVMTKIYDQLLAEVTTVSPEEAQHLANEGKLIIVWSKKYEHAAVVCPSEKPYNNTFGPLVTQAGWNTGTMYISSMASFGDAWTDPEIKYFAPNEVIKDGE